MQLVLSGAAASGELHASGREGIVQRLLARKRGLELGSKPLYRGGVDALAFEQGERIGDLAGQLGVGGLVSGPSARQLRAQTGPEALFGGYVRRSSR